jgi:hypothetical protein
LFELSLWGLRPKHREVLQLALNFLAIFPGWI